MEIDLPANAPKTTGEAFAYLGRLKDGASIDDLKILALTEALGKKLYDDMADRAEHPEVEKLLRANGREELAHAHRVGKAIEALTGEAFPIPPIEDIPFYTPIEPMPITRAAFAALAEGEFGGEDLYDGIASGFELEEALALFKQNGIEERRHGDRLLAAVALLPE